MVKQRTGSRGSRRAKRQRANDGEGGGFLGQLGLAETGTGLSHGPMAIVLAIAAAIVVYPLAWLVRTVRRRS